MGASLVGSLAGSVAVARPGTSHRSRLARDTEALLSKHLDEPPTIAALSEALGTSERTLHAAFHDHLGTTPKAYLKALRLNAARQDLIEADKGTRVTDVALRFGFLHFGWFAHDYRRHFGETPSRTLRRTRQARAVAA
jgi:AraC family ethanolamine operon transcriptional activator